MTRQSYPCPTAILRDVDSSRFSLIQHIYLHARYKLLTDASPSRMQMTSIALYLVTYCQHRAPGNVMPRLGACNHQVARSSCVCRDILCTFARRPPLHAPCSNIEETCHLHGTRLERRMSLPACHHQAKFKLANKYSTRLYTLTSSSNYIYIDSLRIKMTPSAATPHNAATFGFSSLCRASDHSQYMHMYVRTESDDSKRAGSQAGVRLMMHNNELPSLLVRDVQPP